MHTHVGIRSLAVGFPSVVRTNEYFRRAYPEEVSRAEQNTLARVFTNLDPSAESHAFDLETGPYMSDPFRGTVERRVFAAGESPLALECRVARDALAAAKLTPEDVDLLICCALLPENIGAGDAAFILRDLGMRAVGWNLDSTCSSALQALHTACALVCAGAYRRVLVVVSCDYSRHIDERDSLSWFLGDGAGAFVVAEVERGRGLLGWKSVHTASTCDTFFYGLEVTGADQAKLVIRSREKSGRALRDASTPSLRQCCLGAAEAAGVRLDQIDCFVFNTPVAWFHKFAARALEVDPARILTTYPTYANVGPALMPVNLYHSARAGLLHEDALVLAFTIGSVSTAAAAVMRWGAVALGPAPLPSSELRRE